MGSMAKRLIYGDLGPPMVGVINYPYTASMRLYHDDFECMVMSTVDHPFTTTTVANAPSIPHHPLSGMNFDDASLGGVKKTWVTEVSDAPSNTLSQAISMHIIPLCFFDPPPPTPVFWRLSPVRPNASTPRSRSSPRRTCWLLVSAASACSSLRDGQLGHGWWSMLRGDGKYHTSEQDDDQDSGHLSGRCRIDDGCGVMEWDLLDEEQGI